MYDHFRNVVTGRGLSVYRVAKDTGISPSDLYSVLSGNKKFFPGWMRRVADYLGEDPAELFPEEVTK